MACSDNVVRAGLTPKYRDKDTLCQMLTYIAKAAADNIFSPKPHPKYSHITIYDPPTPEFAVARIELPEEGICSPLPLVKGPSIIIVLEGRGKVQLTGVEEKMEEEQECSKGDVFFLPAGHQIAFSSSLRDPSMILYQAYCQL